MYVVIDGNLIDTMMPPFGLIKAIFTNGENHPFIICEIFETKYFDDYFQAFNVKKTKNLLCISMKQLGNINPTHQIYLPISG